MKKTIKLTERDIERMTKKIIREFNDPEEDLWQMHTGKFFDVLNKQLYPEVLKVIKYMLHNSLEKRGYGADSKFEEYNFDKLVDSRAHSILNKFKNDVTSNLIQSVRPNSKIVDDMIEYIDNMIEVEGHRGRKNPFIRN